MPIQDDFSVAVNGDIRYTGGATFTTAATGVILPRQPTSFSQPRIPRN